MGFEAIQGQPTVVQTLERALRSDHVHHAYRFEGPDGVGKEAVALQLAQALVCENPESLGCGECSACTRTLTVTNEEPHVPVHPDVIFIERGLYPPESIGGKSEATGVSVDQIRQIVLPRIGFPPHEGRALCIIVRRAEELTLSAANALLKTLEEPPPRTHFILLTSRPGRLLDTILSRTLAVRFRPLPVEVIAGALAAEGLPVDVAPMARGSLTRARALAEPEARRARDEFVEAADAALKAQHIASASDFADQRPESRDELRTLLAHLATEYAVRARSGDEMALWAVRHREVEQALSEVERNGAPALVLEAMVTRLRSATGG